MKHEHQWRQLSAEGGNPLMAGHQYLVQVSYYCTVKDCGRIKQATQSASTCEWHEELLDEEALVDVEGEVGEPGAVIGTTYKYFGAE